MDLADLSYLATVDRAGSLSAAARALNMTQPGLTEGIRRLEGQFGCRILVVSAWTLSRAEEPRERVE